jgi:MoaA/NifB/PqqE/SkfB family radical SAM enzyme
MDLEILEGEVLHVHVGDRCPNRCLFCNEDTAVRRARVAGTTVADVAAVLDRFPGVPEVLFTCGEPTQHPSLPDFVSLARSRGFARIALITNGRRLADDAYLRGLVARGLTKLAISVHGHTAELHDALTRRPGSFAEVAQGLAHVARLRAEGAALHVTLNAVITRHNRPHLAALHAWFARFRPDEVIFNAVSPRSRGDRHFDALMDPYADILAALEPLNRPFLAPPLRVMEIPGCVLVHGGFLHSGGRESWLVYEKDVAEIETTAAMSPFFEKLPSCAECRLNPTCEGFYRRYAERFGTAEFVPVRAPDRFPRPIAALLHPLAPDTEVADGWLLADWSLRRMRDALLLTFRHRADGRPLELALQKQPQGLRLAPVGPHDLRAFQREHAALLARVREVVAANVGVLLGRQ